MEEKKTSRPAVDWEAVEKAYRAGVCSLKDIGKEFGVSDAGIIKRAKRDGWTRDLSAKIQAKADALVSEREVSAEVSERTKKAEREVIEANATMLADRVIHQRTDISRARATVQRLWAMVDAELDHPGDFAKVGELLRCEDEFGQDKLNDLYRAAIALPQQVKNATELPAQLYHDHADAIAHGVAGLLYAQPDRPWSDPKRAGYHRTEFVEGWRRAGRFRKEHSAPTQVEFHNPPRKHSFF